jgi:hypothetical protein
MATVRLTVPFVGRVSISRRCVDMNPVETLNDTEALFEEPMHVRFIKSVTGRIMLPEPEEIRLRPVKKKIIVVAFLKRRQEGYKVRVGTTGKPHQDFYF